MSAHIIDSILFRDQYGTPEMRLVFDDVRLVQRWLDVEAALARAEARLGLIPEAAALAITEAAHVDRLDLEQVKLGIDTTGHPLVPFIRAFAAVCPDGTGEYLHWGATTQDIMDTALVLQIKDACELLDSQLQNLLGALARQMRRHRATVMAGRTHGQHALPITLGFKLAVMMAEFLRHYERMQHMKGRLFVIQFSGAVGTLASLGNAGRDVQAEFARELGLGQPLIAWHSARDTIAEFVTVVSMIGASCAKAANEVIQLQRNEIAEIAEPTGSESVGSSTMPQKRNPMMCEAVVAIGRIVRQDAALVLDCMVQQHERDMSAWQAEWECVPEAAVLVSGALEQTRRIYEELAVDPERMMSNLAITGGQITAEAVMMSLAPLIGRQRAHHAVADAARQSSEHRRPFAACLSEQPDVAAHLGRGDIERLLNPEAYLGESVDAVDRVLAAFGRI